MGCSFSNCCLRQEQIDSSRESWVMNIGETGKLGSFIDKEPSDEGEDETEDQFHHLGTARDSDADVSRLSRISSQFLPPEGSRTVRVPLGNYNLKYSYLSQRGFYPEDLRKPNQGSFCVHSPFGTNPDDHFFEGFDGHGENGAQCSQFVKRKLCKNLLRNSRFRVNASEALHAAFLETNSQLHSDILDDRLSGTTAIVILIRSTELYVANAGDSRAAWQKKEARMLWQWISLSIKLLFVVMSLKESSIVEPGC